MPEKIYKVFVSSTSEDLREERAAVQKGLLQLGCFPVGMEIFPAADEETWDFIKSEINDSDYYVVLVAGRYGSEGSAGLSFTEMEYDYAIAQKKPAIGFVHADPGSIPMSKTEIAAEARAKLQKFIEKIKKRPVRLFKNPHELALEVTTSFVQLIRDRPAVGYVRTDASVDFKKYSEVLEENNKLKEALNAAQQQVTAPFPAHEKPIQLTILAVSSSKPLRTVDCSLMRAFQAVAEGTLQYDLELDVLAYAAKLLIGRPEDDKESLGFDETSIRTLRRELVLYGLIEIVREDRSTSDGTPMRVTIWRLTDYGRCQLVAIAP
jgi:nucleoside 2-deoxyribosyltransferase